MRYFYLDGKIPVECSKEECFNKIIPWSQFLELEYINAINYNISLNFKYTLTANHVPLLFSIFINQRFDRFNINQENHYFSYDSAISDYKNIVKILDNNLELAKPDVERTYKRICLRQ
ncbi:MAG: hypothetical protein M0R17_03150 [Candidatus Omnitrophica bacterium]|jgi:hypothetical protein|nr:hypothetical protein [Candidatus Omnitrophota bacterium]